MQSVARKAVLQPARFSISAFVIVVGLVQAAAASAADLTELKVGLSAAGNTSLSMLLAQDSGLYAARGLKADMRVFDAGSHGAAEVQAGRLDAMHVGLSAVVELDRAGADLRLIASLVNVVRFSLFVAPGVNTAADLKGGVMAVSGFGSESDSTMRLALSRLGLKPGEVVMKEVSGNAARIAALKSGAMKGAMLGEPTATTARREGLRIMVDLAAERIPWVYSALVVRRGDLSTRRALIKQFLQATAEGAYLGLADPVRAKEVLAREGKISDPAILAMSYDEFRRETPPMLEPTRQEAENVLAQFPGGSSRIEDYVDTSLIGELKQEGFFAAMARKYGTP
jgi:NitT/TauT family transport system substrate-binding protein